LFEVRSLAKSYRELRVWNKAMDLATLIYSVTGDFPKEEIYGLSSQMRRAAVSIASNIAEGSARGTRKDFKQFVSIARGSNCELQTQLLLAKRLGFGTPKKVAEAEELTNDVGQMLSGLSKYLDSPRIASRAKDLSGT
jgi:four helix bundle protein